MITLDQSASSCADISNFTAFTYFGSGGHPYQDLCMLFSSCDTLDDCNDCLTSNEILDCTCGINYEGSVNSETLVQFEEDVLTEQDCRRRCSNDQYTPITMMTT